MEFQVKEVTNVETKSAQQVEEALLKKHEEKHGDPNETTIVDKIKNDEAQATVVENKAEEPQESTPVKLEEKDVLSFIGERYGKEINSMDELMTTRDTNGELPKDVAAYLKYKKETGRGIEDYVKLNKNLDDINPDKILADYYLSVEDGLDDEDVKHMMSEFSYDEDIDEESDIKKKKLAKKRAVSKAKKYFEEQKEKYSHPLESSEGGFSESDKQNLEDYKQRLVDAKGYEEESAKKAEWFLKKTDEVFNNEFKGFDYEVGGKKVTYSPGTTQELKVVQSDINNFIEKFLDNDGLVSDAASYHKALAAAMNPEKLAQFFYEQGKADAVAEDAKNAKNIDMGVRRTPEPLRKGGLQIKAVSSPSNNNGLRIRSNKNN